MRKSYIIFAVIAIFLPVTLFAQTLTNREIRHINEKVLFVIDEYERLASIPTRDAEYEFKSLFVDNAPIVSDIMGNLSYLNTISIDDYIKHLKSTDIYTEIRDVQKHTMKYDKDKWHIAISFRKQLYYYDEFGVYFDVRRYYAGNDLDVTMNLVYDRTDDICYIESIDCSPNSSIEFPRGRFIIIDQKNSAVRSRDVRYLNMLKADEKILHFDDNGYAIYRQNTEFTIDDFDVEVKKSIDSERVSESYDFVKFAFEPRVQRAKFRMAFAPFAYKVSNSDNVAAKSSAFDVGVDYGLTFRSLGTSKMGVYIGAGLSFSNISLALNTPISYSYTISSYDSNTGMYNPSKYDYKITDAKEKVQFVDLFVPIYFEMEHRLGSNKRLVFNWNVGLKSYVNLSATAKTPYTATFSVNASSTQKTFEKFIEPNTYAKNLFDVSAMVNAGVDYNILNNRVYVTANLGYEYGILNSYESNKTPYHNAIIPKITGSGIEHVAVHSLISGIKAKRSAMWISLGVKLKF